MTAVLASKQLETFSMIKSIILSNPTLSQYFDLKSFYEFDPKVKSTDFQGYPFMIIEVPETDPEEMYLGNITNDKEFTINIRMIVDYIAKDKVARMVSEVLNVLRAGNSAYMSYGYNFGSLGNDKPEVGTLNQKDVIITEFELVLRAQVDV